MSFLPNGAENRMFALVDCNNFYVSCERALQPRLQHRPVVVLSNNDGCVVARSNEVKELGVRMGMPWFQMQELARRHKIVALSSNYMLYGDMSNRAASILRSYSPEVEVYSIDESFLSLKGLEKSWESPSALGQSIRARVLQWTGLPVCVGIGASKTLSKLANHIAKKREEFGGVCDLASLTEAEVRALLSGIDVGEVWGVGGKIAARLRGMGIAIVQALRETPLKRLRTHFGVVMERTGSELQGISCLALEDVSPPRQQIISSRSFGAKVAKLEELREAVSAYTLRATERLRSQRSVCGAIHVHIRTSPFLQGGQRYDNGIVVPLPEPTDDSRLLAGAALSGLALIFRDGYQYQKAGVMLMELSDRDVRNGSLFCDPAQDARSSRLMEVMDSLNRSYGRETLHLASAGVRQRWATRAESRSPRYTTCWDEIPCAYAR